VKYTFGDNASNEGRAERIRKAFVAGRTVGAHTDVMMDAGEWSDSELRAKAAIVCRAEVRRALKGLVDGMPWAGSTSEKGADGSPVWKQRELWAREDYEHNCHIYRRDIAERAVLIHNKLAAECREKYGVGPTLLALAEAED
jgi:hypothetical protein